LQDLEKRAFGIVPHLTLPKEKEAQSWPVLTPV
jgi:hypothetical protein